MDLADRVEVEVGGRAASHLLRLLELRDPRERRHGVQTLRIGIVEQMSAMERFFVASESSAVVPLPSFHGSQAFDCGILLGREAAVGLGPARA